jgi:hypothetical protein
MVDVMRMTPSAMFRAAGAETADPDVEFMAVAADATWTRR